MSRQAACWSLLGVIIGAETAGNPADRPELPVPPSPPPVVKPVLTGANPVAQVNEHAQRHKLTPPVWTFESAGPANAPVFTCTATYQQITATGTGSTKTTARLHAAQALSTVRHP